jgi:CheY-like chemotaxis protein
MAGTVAHDLNNYLASILGNASLALRQLPDGSPARQSVEAVQAASRQASDLVGQLLGFVARPTAGATHVNLSQLVSEMMALLRTVVSRRALVRAELDPCVPLVTGDPAQLRQVVMNLLTNAADALEGHSGSIRVRTSVVDLGAARLATMPGGSALAPGAYVCLEVSDTGCGMTSDTAQRIFEPFFTTKARGSGLGLSAVRDILERHAGTVSVDSQPRLGSTLTVYIPAAGPAACAEPGRVEAPAAGELVEHDWRGSGLIMVVDDESGVRDFLTRVLVGQGFEVIVAADGREALDIFGRHADAIGGVLLDLTMPYLDGEQVMVELLHRRPSLRVVLMSGYGEEHATRATSSEAVAFLKKPFECEDVLSVARAAWWDGQES